MSHSQQLLRSRARALQVALIDATRTVRVRLFVDADIVLGVFLRFDEVKLAVERYASKLSPSVATDPSSYVAARVLWAAGYSGKAELLCSHAMEVHENLQPDKAALNDKSQLDAVRNLVNKSFSPELTTRIRTVLDTPIDDMTARNGVDLEALLPLEHFALAVAALPTWKERLQLIGDQITSPCEVRTRDFVQTLSRQQDSVGRLARELQMSREVPLRRTVAKARLLKVVPTRNSYRDACAAVELNALASQGDKCIFVTGTPALSQLADSRIGRRLLPELAGQGDDANDALDVGVTDRPSGSFRSAQYLTLRSLCPAIGFPDARELSYSKNHLEQQRDDIVRMIIAARGILTRSVSKDDCLGDWHRTFEAMVTSRGFERLWSGQRGLSIQWIVDHVTADLGVAKTLNLLDLARPQVEEATFLRLVEVAEQIETMYERVRRSSEETDDLGIGRWLLIATEPFGQLDEFLDDVFEECKSLLPAFSGTSDEWRLILGSRSSSLEAQVAAAAHLFARGRHADIAACEIAATSMSDGDALTPGLRFSLSVIRQCASLRSSDSIGSLASYRGQTSEEATEIIGAIGGAQTKLLRVRCMYAMEAWRAFYWCHEKSRRAGGLHQARAEIAQLMAANTDVVGAVVAELENSVQSQSLSVPDEGHCAALMERPVAELLVAAGMASDESRASVVGWVLHHPPVGAIAVDARAWMLLLTRSPEKEMTRAMVRDVCNNALPRETEPYLREHQLLLLGFQEQSPDEGHV